ncbi:hypothetical protein [Salinivirga cyanobacteriivorans]
MKKITALLMMLYFMAFIFSSCELVEEEDDEQPSEEYINETIDTDVTWQGGTYIIEGTLRIENGGHLTIDPGTTIKFEDGGRISVAGANSALTAVGTANAQITFTSVSNTPSAGSWDYINFESTATGTSSLQYCIIEYGGGYASTYGGALWLEGPSISVDHCTVSNSAVYGVVCDDDSEFTSFTNNTLMDNDSYDIYIEGNAAHTIGSGNVIDGSGILVDGDTYTQSEATWSLQTAPFTIDGTLYVQSDGGATLNIAAGNTIQFTEGSQMTVGSDGYGTFKAIGTESLPILFTSTSTQKQGGQWDYIGFENGSVNSELSYCIVEAGGGYASYVGAIDINDAAVSIDNTEIRLSATYAITLDNAGSFASFSNNNIHDVDNYVMQIYGNWAHTIGTGNNYGEDDLGILVHGDAFEHTNETWLFQSTAYVIDGTLSIESASGSTLEIEAGSTIKFTDGSEITVGYSEFGKLVVNGTSALPVTFTTSAPAGGEQPGDWDGIFFESNTMNGSILNYCNISYGGGYATTYDNGNINLDDVSSGEPTISNCIISYSAGWGIYNSNSSPTLISNTYNGNANGDIGN